VIALAHKKSEHQYQTNIITNKNMNQKGVESKEGYQ